MPQLIKPHETQILTKDGECQVAISLELIIKLEGDQISVSGMSTAKKEEKKEVFDNELMIQDFTNTEKILFGKNESGE